MKSLLIFGSGGGLGQTFLLESPRAWDPLGLNHAQADVTNLKSVTAAIEKFEPSIVINSSGYTAVDKAEVDRDSAWAVNVTGVKNLVEACSRTQIPFVTFSTDYIFSGDGQKPLQETAQARPGSVYGQSKLEGESEALKYAKSLVIRTSWLYSESGKSFPKTILSRAIKGESLKVVNDQTSSPTFAVDLVHAVLQLLNQNYFGLVHYSSAGETNWHEFASAAIQEYNSLAKTNFAKPSAIRTADLNLAAPRPSYSTLNCQKALSLGVKQRHWKEALKDFVQRLYSKGSL
jgi:dTDP-4-dehydrorhamnose reductase